MRLTRHLASSLTALCLMSGSALADFGCSHDACIERINAVLKKMNPDLLVSKRSCTEENDSRSCRYVNKNAPGINLVSDKGKENVRVAFIVDTEPGLSPAGGVYIAAIIEALDPSMDEDARKTFFNKLMRDFALGDRNRKTPIQMSSAEVKYLLSWNDKFLIFGAHHEK